MCSLQPKMRASSYDTNMTLEAMVEAQGWKIEQKCISLVEMHKISINTKNISLSLKKSLRTASVCHTGTFKIPTLYYNGNL